MVNELDGMVRMTLGHWMKETFAVLKAENNGVV